MWTVSGILFQVRTQPLLIPQLIRLPGFRTDSFPGSSEEWAVRPRRAGAGVPEGRLCVCAERRRSLGWCMVMLISGKNPAFSCSLGAEG